MRLLTVLRSGGRGGVLATDLISVGGYGEADAFSQLGRDFRHLRDQGWQINNIGGAGEGGRYVLISGDNRLRLTFGPDELEALRRAALLADRDDLVSRFGLPDADRPADISADLGSTAPGVELTTVIDAVRDARLVRFRYKGSERVVHPGAVRHQNGQWYLSAVEDGAHELDPVPLKHFVIGRMSEVRTEAAGTAERVPDARLELHPMRWRIDPPVDVVVQTPVDFEADVVGQLREPRERAESGEGLVELTYEVTNRAAFRSRVYALGTRVRLLGPDDVRDEILSELREMAGL